MKDKLIKILLLNKRRQFRLCSVTRGNDRSIYFHFPINSELKRNNASAMSPVKYSYHPSGKMCRITGGEEKKRGFEFKSQKLPPIEKIKNPVGLCKMSFFDLKNNIGKFLDKPGSNDYQNLITISSKNYSSLTIRVFLCAKDFSIPIKRIYRETHIFPLDDIKVIITFQDLWVNC